MSHRPGRCRAWLRSAEPWFLAAAFVLSHSQSPLFTSNQHTYFLQGLADAGYGQLQGDFLVNTADPYPLFSALVSLTHLYLPDGFFHLYLIALKAIFLLSLLGITAALLDFEERSNAALLTASVFILATSAFAFRHSRIYLGFPLPQFAGGGLAAQGMPGYFLQPSSFGVFLLLSIWLFLRRRPRCAIVSIAVAISFHPTYLLSGASLTLAYMFCAYRAPNGGLRPALRLGGLSIALALPVIVHGLLTFTPSSAGTFAEATRLLAQVRLPHHAQIVGTLDAKVYAQLALLVIALLICCRKRTWAVLAIPTAIAVILTAIQVSSGSNSLALMFPWRASSFLMPLSFCLVSGFLLRRGLVAIRLSGVKHHGSLLAICLIPLVLASHFGFSFTLMQQRRHEAQAKSAFFQYVREHVRASDRFLIPVRMLTFRLETGAAIYIDHKTHPLKDSEVVSWFDRLRIANGIYNDPRTGCEELGRLIRRGLVSHVVGNQQQRTPECEQLYKIYDDGRFTIHRIGVSERPLPATDPSSGANAS